MATKKEDTASVQPQATTTAPVEQPKKAAPAIPAAIQKAGLTPFLTQPKQAFVAAGGNNDAGSNTDTDTDLDSNADVDTDADANNNANATPNTGDTSYTMVYMLVAVVAAMVVLRKRSVVE